MTSELAERPRGEIAFGRGVSLTSLDDAFRFAAAVAKSGLAPQGLKTPEQIIVALQTGMESGLSPMAALRAVVVINGLPSWRSESALALVRQSGKLATLKDEAIKDKDGKVIGWRVYSKRRDGDERTTEFGERDAHAAGLFERNPTYRKYPGRMYRARALGWNLRDQFPEVLMGMVTEAEARDYEPLKDALGEVVEAPRTAPAEPDPLMTALLAEGEPVAEAPASPEPPAESAPEEPVPAPEALPEPVAEPVAEQVAEGPPTATGRIEMVKIARGGKRFGIVLEGYERPFGSEDRAVYVLAMSAEKDAAEVCIEYEAREVNGKPILEITGIRRA